MCLYKCFLKVERESLEPTINLPSSNQFLETAFISSEVYLFILLKSEMSQLWNDSKHKLHQFTKEMCIYLSQRKHICDNLVQCHCIFRSMQMYLLRNELLLTETRHVYVNDGTSYISKDC